MEEIRRRISLHTRDLAKEGDYSCGNGLTEGVEQLLLTVIVVQGFAQDFARQDATLATLARDAQNIVHISERTRPLLYRGADLGIGNAFAETDVHVCCRDAG